MVKSHCPGHIPFQLSQHHLIPITLIIAAGDASERAGESGRGNKMAPNSHYREQECKYSQVTSTAKLVTNNNECLTYHSQSHGKLQAR